MKNFKQYLEEEIERDFQIFCDLDGVLVNLGKGIKIFGLGTFEQIDEKDEQEKLFKMIKEVGSDFWVRQEWMKDGKILWNFIKNKKPIILTAPPITGSKEAEIGKRLWCRNNIGKHFKVEVVPAHMKKKFAKSNHILIDDMKKNIDGWIANGGIGILHTSAEDTINKLKNIYGD